MKEKRIRKVTVRFTEAEYREYLNQFEKNSKKYSQSAYIRDCIFQNIPVINNNQISNCDKDRVRQIAGLTNNINQIARRLNALKYKFDDEEFLNILEQLETISNYCKSALYEEE